MRIKLGVLAALGALALVVAVSAALGTPPAMWHHYPGFSGSATVTTWCSAPITLNYTETDFTEIDYFNNAGVPTMIKFEAFEQDTFIGPNGIPLVGEKYLVESHWIFDSTGTLVLHDYVRGVLEKVWLPDGTLFQSAGSVDFVADGGGFIITPDVGHSGNVAGFCAALGA